MTARILFIDDEKNVLSAFQRTLRSDFDVAVASSGEDGIKAASLERFAVVVCDMRMPGLNGVDTLKEIAEISPDSTRIMLTGNADQETPTRAINEGRIFRFLSKPCADGLLRDTLKAAIRQYELVTAERDLLEKTLSGSVRVLMDVLSLAQPRAFGRAARVRHWSAALAKDLGLANPWEVNIAAALAPIGMVGLEPDIIEKLEQGRPLTASEQEEVQKAPETAQRLIGHIPRLQNVAAIVLNQNRGYDGSGFPDPGPAGDEIPEGARLLRLLNDLSLAGDAEVPTGQMVARLRATPELYDPQMLLAARRLWGSGQSSAAMRRIKKEVGVDGLLAGDSLLADIELHGGKLLLGAGLQITAAQIERLRALRRVNKIKEPLLVGRLVQANDGLN